MRLILMALLAAVPVLAQQSTDPSERIQKLVPLKYVEPSIVANVLHNFGVEINYDSRSKVVALAGKRANVMTAEDAIKQLDVPASVQKDIDLSVFFVMATDQPNATGTPIPSDLQSTVAALKSTFPFKSYTLLDALSLRTRSGVRADTSGQFGARITYFGIRAATVEPDGVSIRLEGLHSGLRNPVTDHEGKRTYVDTGISTDLVDVKDGQKLVIGRSSLDGPSTPLFLVLIAKIVQ